MHRSLIEQTVQHEMRLLSSANFKNIPWSLLNEDYLGSVRFSLFEHASF
jgi:hypothetical protein